MKAELFKIEVPVKRQPIKFPVLAELIQDGARDKGCVVLFNSFCEGTCVLPSQCKRASYTLGYKSTGWVAVDIDDMWRILEPYEVVQLSNEE